MDKGKWHMARKKERQQRGDAHVYEESPRSRYRLRIEVGTRPRQPVCGFSDFNRYNTLDWSETPNMYCFIVAAGHNFRFIR
jgi:hypothetical protein